MTFSADHELWAIALWAEKHHGADGPRFIAEQIGHLVLEGDEAGVERWKQVAKLYQTLDRGGCTPT